jgi:hypothetical protein
MVIVQEDKTYTNNVNIGDLINIFNKEKFIDAFQFFSTNKLAFLFCAHEKLRYWSHACSYRSSVFPKVETA